MKRAFSRIAALALAASVACGCAGLIARPLPPKVEVAGIEGASFSGSSLKVGVVLNVHNPNAFPVAIDTLEANIAIEGTPAATGHLPMPITLAANADTRARIDTSADVQVLGNLVERVIRQGALAYEITGYAVLADGRRLDYRRKGELSAADLLKRMR